ncbi:hypothetical protein J5N97_023717 [Dioscorea zingiberensis]|uniref:DUF4283 domain-containing protein n=1 Tax=Dioscorea zingiberensis TaxID=325984 RepID=A0A9D5C5C9_9LILI|nr:hypothetical protein J5N97_023717 [Dioscorea zingiberensis]
MSDTHAELGKMILHGGKTDEIKGKMRMKERETNTKATSGVAEQGSKTSLKEVIHHVSLAVDESMLMEKEKLRRCIIATVTRAKEGMVGYKAVMAEVAADYESELNWGAEPVDNARVLIWCPSEEIARGLVKRGMMEYTKFIARFELWTSDIDSTGKSDDEIRWIYGRGLPMYCRKRDTLIRILKPVGELVHLGSRDGLYTSHFRAMVRLRRGRRLPAIIDCSIFRAKYSVRIELEKGQPPLPWEPATTKDEVNVSRREDDERRRKGKDPVKPLDENLDKVADMTGRGASYGRGEAHDKFEDEEDDEMNEQLEKEIKLEFEQMWQTRLEWEESKMEEEQAMATSQKSPNDQALKDNHGKHGGEMEPIKGPDGPDSLEPTKTLELNKCSTTNGPPEIQQSSPHNPKEIITSIPGQDGYIDLSKYTWQLIQGSWNLIENSALEGILTGEISSTRKTQAEGQHKEIQKAPHQQKKTTTVLPNDGIRRSA